MELKPGYKQTELGVIPEDWDVKTLAGCCDYVDYRGKTPAKTPSGTFLVTARNVRKGFVDYEDSKEYVATEQYELIMRRGKPRIGDVLITTEAPLGNVAQVDREDVALAQRIIKYRPKSADLSSSYLKHYLLSDRFQGLLDAHASGSTAKGIKGSVLHQLLVVIPPSSQQRAIAESLSDADALIESLDQLIAKKCHLKQGAMQELLTGKRRLPGFSGERGCKQTELGMIPDDWECVESANVAIYFGGNAFKSDAAVSNGIRWLKIANVGKGGIQWTDLSYLPTSYAADFKDYLLQKGDVVMALTRPILNSELKIAKLTEFDVPSLLNQRVAKIIPRSKANLDFIYHTMRTRHFVDSMNEAMAGTDPPNIGSNALGKIQIAVPPTISEQRAIAEALSDMDAEIAALETKLTKTQNIKQRMMQELLTGRIRLI